MYVVNIQAIVSAHINLGLGLQRAGIFKSFRGGRATELASDDIPCLSIAGVGLSTVPGVDFPAIGASSNPGQGTASTRTCEMGGWHNLECVCGEGKLAEISYGGD